MDGICQQNSVMDNIASFKKKKTLESGKDDKKIFTKVFCICSDGQSVTGCLNEKISNNNNNTTLYTYCTSLHLYKVSSDIMCGGMGRS